MASALELFLLAQASSYPKPWTALALQNSWTTPAGVQPLSYRYLNPDVVQIAGSLEPGTTTSAVAVAAIPVSGLTDQRFPVVGWSGTATSLIMARIVPGSPAGSATTLNFYGAMASGVIYDVSLLLSLDA